VRFGTDTTVVTHDGQISHPVLDGVICLTVAAAQPANRLTLSRQELHPITAGLQRFYDDVGWQPHEERFTDAKLFEDLRPVSADYIHRCHLRVRDHLPPSGELLLDAGCGAVQFPEYVAYQDGFRKRLCVDISLGALKQARGRLGERAIYVQDDIARLPIADQSVDAAVSLHTIYHIPAELQEQAFLELHRVLKPGGRAVIVYSWAQTQLWRVLHAPIAIKLRVQRLGARLRHGSGIDEQAARERAGFHFLPHSAAWFLSRQWPFAPRILVWRLASVPALKLYVHRWLGGRWLLRALFRAENRWPKRLGLRASYPLIVIDRAADARTLSVPRVGGYA
jgi:ubiquinone/menaquinone biosynthesis C-methylase UbiE